MAGGREGEGAVDRNNSQKLKTKTKSNHKGRGLPSAVWVLVPGYRWHRVTQHRGGRDALGSLSPWPCAP